MANDSTAALVVALSAQLTKFEKAMQDAGNLSDRTVSSIEDRWSRLNPTFAGSFLGNFAGSFASSAWDRAIKLVEDLKNRFLDLRDVAHLVQVDMNELFGIQQAASKAGVSIDDTTKSVRQLATLLDQMKRGEKNSLSALFDANPQALQGVNRDALTLQQTLKIVADLVQNAQTNIQKVDLAQAAGQAEGMVKFLEKGGEAVTRLSSAAAQAAPDLQKLADKAKEFDDAWKAVADKMKAYAAENWFGWIKQDLTDIVALLGLAERFLALFKGGLIEKQTSEAAKQIGELRSIIDRFNTDHGSKTDNPTRVVVHPAPGGGTSTRDPNRPLSNVPRKDTGGGGNTADAFDRTAEQITKHTAAINADTLAVFQNNAARAQLRAEFTLLNAIRKDEGEVTQAQLDQYQKLRASMTAEQALEQAHINLSPAHKKAFIDASEGAKTATANYDAAREKLNELNAASQQVGSALSTAFADAVVEGKSLSDVVSSLIKTLEKAAINSLFAQFFSPQGGNALSGFASFISGARADGGPVSAGKAYIVGERRPEVFVPSMNGTIIPDVPRAGGSNGSNSFNVTISMAGANGDATIRQIAAQATLQGSRAVLAQVPGMAVKAVSEHMKRAG